MKVYFACSIRGGGDTSNYIAIVDAIKSTGATLMSEIFVHDALNLGGSPLPEEQIYERDINMIKECDVVIAEVTNPSLGVGYELGFAETLHKPILCLSDTHSDKKLSAMVTGNPYNRVENYSSSTIEPTITNFLTNNS